MHGDALLLLLVMVLGCAAFFFGIIYMVFRAVAWLGRGFLGMLRGRPLQPSRSGDAPPDPRWECPNPGCGRVEPRTGARYCSQCGAGLRPISRTGHHGG